MIDFEGDSFHTHEQAVALIATFYKASYSKLLGLVRKRFRSLEAEDIVEELFVKILAQVDAARTIPEPLDHSWKVDNARVRVQLPDLPLS